MNLHNTLDLFAAGTSEGAKKAWDTRGRGRKQQEQTDQERSGLGRSGRHPGYGTNDKAELLKKARQIANDWREHVWNRAAG